MREIYRLNDIDELTPATIDALVQRFKINEVPRIKRLESYYRGDNDIKDRKMADPLKPNNKISHGYGGYITDVINGYFLGSPVSYSSEDDNHMEKLQEVFDKNHEGTINARIGKSISICGIGYELVYVNETLEIKQAVLDPKSVFMVYDSSIETRPLCAVRFYETSNYVDDTLVTNVEVYTDAEIKRYRYSDKDLTFIDAEAHYFKEVPVIAYQNNDESIGDYEKVVALIDGYDKAVSDSANDLEYFADSYLALSGMPDTNSEDIAAMKENRVLLLDENGKAEWLVKGSNTVQVEEFKDRLKQDIHTLSFVPDLSDESFGGNLSGVAIRYKLFGLEQTVSVKERMFKQALERRIRLITTILNVRGGSFETTNVTMTFTRNLPANEIEMATLVKDLQGVLSNDTLIQLLPFVDDSAYEMQKLEAEQQDTLYQGLGGSEQS